MYKSMCKYLLKLPKRCYLYLVYLRYFKNYLAHHCMKPTNL